MPPPSIFISYSHKDEKEKDILLSHLRVLQHAGLIDVWSDDRIRAGGDWEQEINQAMTRAKVAILLISANFLTSDFILKKEVPALLERRKSEGLTVFPVIAKACAWRKVTWLTKMNVRPKNGRPVWREGGIHIDEDLAAIAEEVADIVEQASSVTDLTLDKAALPTSLPITPPGVIPRTSPMAALTRLPFEPDMILIPVGPFLMGSDPKMDRLAYDDEQPLHPVYLPDYYMAKTPVTNAHYAVFVEDTGYDQPAHWVGRKPPKGRQDHPVVNVSWYDAVEYCRWLSKVTGRSYHLPSEAEWEKGARGNHGQIYPWGSRWYAKRCNTIEAGKGDTTPVGTYPNGASPYGLLDMAGNVWEWTRSLWGEDEGESDFKYPYDPTDGRENPDAPEEVRRVLRSTPFCYPRKFARCACRDRRYPHSHNRASGFRAVAFSV